ncbi:TonB-dependent receptor domain-containing protein [Pseudoalteromonas tunicata]|uniref:TonB-dependent receptor n=1 Tax=Pseudoalteromonas tunicata D2 TaxID=87626 RepID=A4CA05_9GAMM|nr:TonB-dependent receptor [Pseudoalteromonas tunicata]ATC94763.1 iron complex outermembrane recepter protein [Pseudoalteromonas tunicata]AXT30463.1 TonB-dependent receptor [Pseudoalteromonas tunicata]EAR28213.1 TonB-dependent receptor [Pseudoalteromonas tunicata D2]
MFRQLTIAAAISALLCPVAYANTQNNSDTSNIERVEITGSRLKGVDLEGTVPLTVLDQDAIIRSGANTIHELLKDLSVLKGGNGTFSTSESGGTSNSTPAGQAAASLRGMGPSATLTLINGRRVAPSSFAAGTENFVDINAIPLAAIERIEILATGASAVYGADAVAGVINYILKEDFTGAQLNGAFSNSTAQGDNSKTQLNLVYGTKIGDTNLTLFADIFDRNPLKATDRAISATAPLTNSYSYLPTLENAPNVYYYSSRSGDELPAPNCQTPLTTTEYGEEICAYYPNQHDYLETPFESISAGLMLNSQFGEVQWHTDFFFSQTKSTAYSSPAPINQINDSDGPFVLEDALFIFDNADGSNALLDQLYIDPFTTQSGRTVYGFGFDARFNDPRTVEVETKNFRLVSSLEGEIGDWSWETGVTLSRSRSSQEAVAGVYNRYQFHGAITGELCADGSLASFDGDNLNCGNSQLLPFYNPFLQGDASNDAILALTQARPTRDGESTVYGWDANISGEIFTFNDLPAYAAIGVEVRQEELKDIPSNNARADANNGYLVEVFGFGSSVSQAKRQQYAAFVELNVSLTEQIELQAAGRYDHFDDFGGTFNPKIGLSYRPSDSLIVRGSWSTSFRAPSLTQAGVKLRTTQSTFDCGANQAVADLYCMGDGTQISVNTLELGNPQLKAEESNAISVGLAWSPSQNTNLTVDYWRFEHEEVIDTNMTAVLDRAMSDASLRHCGLVPQNQQGIAYEAQVCDVTDANGLNIEQQGANLRQILDAYISEFTPRDDELFLPLYRDHVIPLENTGSQTLAGIDFKFDQRFNFKEGDFTVAISGTHYLTYERNKPGSDSLEKLIGSYRYPKDIARISFDWDAKDYYFTLSANYTSRYQDDIEGLRAREIEELEGLSVLDSKGQHQVDDWLVWDLASGYFVTDELTLRLSITNLFDKEPPRVFGSSRGFDSINHNADGTRYQLGLTYTF